MDLCFVSAAHGRYAISELVFEQRKLLIDELAMAGISAISLIAASDENLYIAQSFGFETLEHENRPLGAKCSAALMMAADMASNIVWCGSDDWIHFDTFLNFTETAIPTIRTGARHCMVDIMQGRLMRCRGHSTYGGVPWIIPSILLRPPRHKAAPIRPDLNNGLDGQLIRGIRRDHKIFTIEMDDPHEFRNVGLKTDENIHLYGNLAGLGLEPEEDAAEALAGYYPDHLIERMSQYAKR